MKAILEDQLGDVDTIRDRFAATDAWVESFEKVSLDAAAETIGLSLSNLKQAASLLAKKGPAQVVTGKRLSHLPEYGIWRTMAAAMGWSGKNGGGWYPLDSGSPELAWAPILMIANSAAVDSPPSMRGLLESVCKGQIGPPKALICSGNLLDDFRMPSPEGRAEAPLTIYFGILPNETSNLSHMLFQAKRGANATA